MPTLTHDCPHCKTINSGFTGVFSKINAVGGTSTSRRWNVFFDCNSCGSGLIAEVTALASDDPMKSFGDLRQVKHFSITKIFPEPTATEVPEFLPPSVGKTYLEACDILKKSPTAAKGMFRRALEIGLKIYDPSDTSSKLFGRINKLAEAHKITPALKEWAHQLRLDGNDAMHEIDEASIEDAEQMHQLTKYLLMYLYTLPHQIEDANKASNQ